MTGTAVVDSVVPEAYLGKLEAALPLFEGVGTVLATAKFMIGQVVRHRIYPFRGVVFDIDPEFDNTEEWWERIPAEHRPRKDQPFYHLLAENETSYYVAYVSEQNLLPDETGDPVDHPEVERIFGTFRGTQYDLASPLH